MEADIAQVPYQPFPTAQPQGGGEKISVQTPGAAFGENIGAALKQLGGTTEQVGNELWGRAVALQDLTNETNARRAVADYGEQQAMMHEKFISDVQADAGNSAGLLQKYISDSKAMREKFRSGLDTPNAQRMYDGESQGFLLRNINAAAGHAGDQFRGWVGDEAIASVKSLQHHWANSNDPTEAEAKIQAGNAGIDAAAPAKRWGPNEVALQKQDFASQVYISQVTNIASNGDPQKAWGMYKDMIADGRIDTKEEKPLQTAIWHENRTIATRNLVDQVAKEGGSMAEMKAKLDGFADDPKISLGDPDFKESLERRLIYDTGQIKHQITYEQNQNEQTLYKGIARGISTPEQLKNDPETGPAYSAMSPKDQNLWDKKVYIAAQNRDTQTNRESKEILQNLADLHPKEYLQQDLYDPKWKLNVDDRKYFIGQRDRLVKQPLEDPFVKQSVNYMLHNFAPQMKALGIINPDTGLLKKGDTSSALLGSLSLALKEFEEVNKHRPTPDEMKEKVIPPVISTHSEPAWFGFSTKEVPEFKRAFPPKDLEKAKAALSEGGMTPTDAEVKRYIMQEQWKHYFQGASQTETAGGGAAVPQSR